MIGLALLATAASVYAIDKNVLSIDRQEQFFKGYTATKVFYTPGVFCYIRKFWT